MRKPVVVIPALVAFLLLLVYWPRKALLDAMFREAAGNRPDQP